MQDAVLVDLAAKVRPGVDVLFLDTGYHFVETIGTRDAVEAVYDINVVNVTPENTVAKQDELFGKDLFAREPNECCRMRKVEPLSKALRGYSAWVTGHPPRRGADPRQRAADQLGQGVRTGEDQPDRGVDRRGHAGLHRRQRCAGQSPCVRGLSVDRLRAVHGQAGRRAPTRAAAAGRAVEDGMRAARLVTVPRPDGARQRRSAVGGDRRTTWRARSGGCDAKSTCGWRSASRTLPICATCSPRLGRNAVVVPLLLADAYHARIDIPAMIAQSGVDARQADVLGEDDRLVAVLRQRLTHAGVSQLDPDVGVLVTAVGSSRPAANARTALVARLSHAAHALDRHHRVCHRAATDAGRCRRHLLRDRGATRLVIAPWFLAHGRITDRVAEFARAQGIPMAAPLGPHRLVADTVLDRFDHAVAERAAA